MFPCNECDASFLGQSQCRVSLHSYLDVELGTVPQEFHGDDTPLTYDETLPSLSS
jgi:hypothetical protein